MVEIHFQPKQGDALDLIENSNARVLGIGGGRGAAKSTGMDNCAVTLALENPKTLIAVVMRNYDQVYRYHVEPIIRAYPEVDDWLRRSSPTKLQFPNGSQIDFTYAESLGDIERRFRSANYKYIFVDQAEQFTGLELGEIRKANRGTKGAKTILLFNMGGIGIQDLRNWFGPQPRFNEREIPEHYKFLHVYPWDNYYWARETGISEDAYYALTDPERFEYFIHSTEYGQQLNALDDSTRARDLLGSWESLEGAYFGRVFDYKATMVSTEQAQTIIRPWDRRWLSTDWGKTHYASTHWHGKSLLSPSEVRKYLGWDVPRPLTVVVTYRRLIVNEQTSVQVAKSIVAATPVIEREQIKRYPFSPEQFGERDSEETVPILIGRELRKFGMPEPERADNSRKPGWGLMYTLLNNTRIWAIPSELRTKEQEAEAGDTVWVISSECPEALETIPVLMRNTKDLDDVVKTDKGQAVLAMDVADDLRYGLQSEIGAGAKPEKVKHAEKLIRIYETTGDRQAMTMAEISFRAQQAQGDFQVSGRRRR